MTMRAAGKVLRLLPSAAALLLIALFAGSCPAWSSGSADLTGAMMSPRFLDGDNASESWNYIFRFPESGYTLFSNFMISNTRAGKHRATAVGILVAPDGRRTLLKNGRARGKWTYLPGEEGLEMRLARHVFRMTPDSHHLHMENNSGTFTIDSVSISRPFFPPAVTLRGGDILERIFLAPRMEVTGTAAFPGEEPVDLGRGRGIAYLERSPVADHERMVSRLIFHTFRGETEVSILEFRGTRKDDYRSTALLLLMKDGEVVFHDSSATVEYSAFREDDKLPSYLIPGEFRFAGASGGKSVEGQVNLALTWRYDWLEALDNLIIKTYMGLYSHPIQCEHEAVGAMKVDIGGKPGAVETTGVAVIHILNPPNW